MTEEEKATIAAGFRDAAKDAVGDAYNLGVVQGLTVAAALMDKKAVFWIGTFEYQKAAAASTSAEDFRAMADELKTNPIAMPK